MQPKDNCAIIEVQGGYIACPICKRNKRLLRISGKSKAECLPIYCRSCKNEVILDIDGQSVKRRSQ